MTPLPTPRLNDHRQGREGQRSRKPRGPYAHASWPGIRKRSSTADFSDFFLLAYRHGPDPPERRLRPRRARFPANRLTTPIDDAANLLGSEAGAIAHMNADHADALALYAQVLAGKPAGAL